MSAEVAAGDGQIKRGAQIVASSKQALDGELKALEGQLSGIGSMWVGQGATAFQQLMTRWREDASKIISALNEFEQNLIGSDKDYTAQDDQQSSVFSNLQGRLG
ncbi:WXG100 family type VII secretion target [Cellulomonas sp. NPDC089187]|uniref:WXG100 family type VII secretion target n=1 Tax=Cellulomonas sp. NPDC089187 TaxID=3154970 RepID=UPI003414212A